MRYEEFENLVDLEIVQKEGEGFEVGEARKAFAARKPGNLAALRNVMKELIMATVRDDSPYIESSNLHMIKKE